MKIKIANGCFLEQVPRRVRQQITKDLRFHNPRYRDAVKHGVVVNPRKTPPYLYFFKKSSDGKRYWVPRGYIYKLFTTLKYMNVPFTVEDYTVEREIESKVDFLGTPKDFQEEAIYSIIESPFNSGILWAPTGSGKTVMGLAIIAERGQRTLIVVHSKELMHQWVERAKKFLGVTIGTVGDSTFDLREITVGILNSVHLNLNHLKGKFGQLVCDEVHRSGGRTYFNVIQQLRAKYIIGLTATPYRSDGLTKIIYYAVGPIIHEVDTQRLQDRKIVLKPKIIKISTQFYHFVGNIKREYNQLITALCENKRRNRLIAKTVYEDLKKYKDRVLIVSGRTKHCEILQELLEEEYGIKSHILLGKTSKKKRKEIVKQFEKGKFKVLISTVSLIGEGFDCPDLSALFITTPIKFDGRVIQTVGRILRPSKGKKPRLYDFRDNRVATLRFSGFARDRVYRNEFKN